MSSVDAFNEMYGDFVSDLSRAFPENVDVKKFKEDFEALKAQNSRGPMDAFMDLARKKSQAFSSRDASFIKEFSFGSVWDGASEQTRGAIWQHLSGLYMIGTTLSMFPPETLAAIESAAKKCADSGAFDPSMMSSMLQGLMGPGGGMNLGSMTRGGRPSVRGRGTGGSAKKSKK